MKYLYFFLFLVFSLLSNFGLVAQELPPIQNFSPLDYNGENQNWSITQGDDNHIYIANNRSLLDYNGVSWKKYASPNNSSIRSVFSEDNLIFTGQYMEFGYWERDAFGKLNYTSISKELKEPMVEDEEFWNIVILDNWVLFQSLDRIYSYSLSSKQFKIIEVKSTKAYIFKVDDSVYFQNQNKGVYKIENGKPVLVVDQKLLEDRNVVGIYKEQDLLVFILDNAKFLKYSTAGVVIKVKNALEPSNITVYSTEKLKDGSYILGTISNGIYQIGVNGALLKTINRRKGLYNNTILSVFQDKDQNLWLGLDNGISVINLNSPFNEYVDNIGRLGLIYTSKLFKGKLYLGTNQGLFFKDFYSDEDFDLIKGTEGQVWSLDIVADNLFCGHNKGTFSINGGEGNLISSFRGTWGVKSIEGENNLLLQGNFNGLSILEKKEGIWSFRNKIEGFNISSRFFEIAENKSIIVNHEIKGLYGLTIDKEYRKVDKIRTHSQMGFSSSLVNYNDKIIYSTINGAFIKTKDSLSFTADTTLNKLLINKAGGIKSIGIQHTAEKRFWYFTKNGLSMLTASERSEPLAITTIPIPSFFRRSLGVPGFENINKIGDDKYLLGISNGFVTLDLKKRRELRYKVEISEISSMSTLGESKVLPGLVSSSLDFEQNNLSFSFAVPQYEKYSEVAYQYRLKGQFEEWSDWGFEPAVRFNNLTYNEYTFEVRAKVGNTLTNNISQYSFTINRPWYLSIVAFLLYFLTVLSFFYLLHKTYKAYYTKKQYSLLAEEKKKLKRKKLKTSKELIQVRNEKLKGEIESKNRELAVSTMSIIKKNEFLNRIKIELNKAENPNHIKSVIRTIDKNINNEDDWKFFEEAFNNADKNFLKKVKKVHPELTSNDLRLCAYLRLNLSSKDIAPLLNISVKSIEVKRYRLRKKMNLPRESSLSEYLMNI